MKIQINSKEALERLIGNDPKMEIAVKESVLNSIAGKYLKSIAHSEVMKKAEEAVNSELHRTGYMGLLQIDTFGKVRGCTEKLREYVRMQVADAFTEIVREAVKEQMSSIKETVNRDLAYALECTLSKVSERNIDRLVQDKITKLMKSLNHGED